MWKYRKDGSNIGPVSFEEIVDLINSGVIDESTMVHEEGSWPCKAGIHLKLKPIFKEIQQNLPPQNEISEQASDLPSSEVVPPPMPEPMHSNFPVQSPQPPSQENVTDADNAPINNGAEPNNAIVYVLLSVLCVIAVLIIIALLYFIINMDFFEGWGMSDNSKSEDSYSENVEEESESPSVVSEEDDSTKEEQVEKANNVAKNDKPQKSKTDDEIMDEQDEPVPEIDDERQKEILAEYVKNVIEARQDGKTIVYVDDFRKEYKTSEDFVPGFSESNNDFHNGFNFWACLYSDQLLDELGKADPVLKRKIQRVRDRADFNKKSWRILTCRLQPTKSVDSSNEGTLSDWVEFTAVYNQNMKKQSFYFYKQNSKNGYLESNKTIKNSSFLAFFQEGRHYWIPAKDSDNNFRKLDELDQSPQWYVRTNKPVYYNTCDGIYSKVKFSLKTKPEIMKDILRHPDDYRLEILTKLSFVNEQFSSVYSVPQIDSGNGDINESEESPQKTDIKEFYRSNCSIMGLQIRNIKTNNVIAIVCNEKYFPKIFQTKVVSIDSVLYKHPEDVKPVITVTNVPRAPVVPTTPRVQPQLPPSQPVKKAEDDDPTRMVKVINGVQFVFRWIPPGVFTMGSPDNETGRNLSEKQHKVKISQGFWMMETEVTKEQWEAVVDDDKYYSYSTKKHPMENISWFECNTFCNQAKTRGVPLELPTEAQWEYACRAGTTGPYAGNMDDMTWYIENSGNRTCEAKKLLPNAWGLYGMHGNVAEWCADWCGVYPSKPVVDPTGPETGTKRMTRGGSWGSPKHFCRSALRGGLEPDRRTVGLGFRCVINKGKDYKN